MIKNQRREAAGLIGDNKIREETWEKYFTKLFEGKPSYRQSIHIKHIGK